MEDMLFPAPEEGFVLTHFLVSKNVAQSADFYVRILGGTAVMEGEPTIVKLSNSWIIINAGGPPTDDKPDVHLDVPSDPNQVSAFLNIRVADINAVYDEWSGKGAQFLTPPTDREAEYRCYIRDPDGHLIEVGQIKGAPRSSGERTVHRLASLHGCWTPRPAFEHAGAVLPVSVYNMRMVRVNVYLPDELAVEAKAAGLNVSSIAQKALRSALAGGRVDEWLDDIGSMRPLGINHRVVASAVTAAKDELEDG